MSVPTRQGCSKRGPRSGRLCGVPREKVKPTRCHSPCVAPPNQRRWGARAGSGFGSCTLPHASGRIHLAACVWPHGSGRMDWRLPARRPPLSARSPPAGRDRAHLGGVALVRARCQRPRFLAVRVADRGPLLGHRAGWVRIAKRGPALRRSSKSASRRDRLDARSSRSQTRC